MDTYNELKEIVLATERDVEKFYVKGIKKAGTRVRKNMQEVRRLALSLRKEISAASQQSASEQEEPKATLPFAS
jgi:hypothetical protein